MDGSPNVVRGAASMSPTSPASSRLEGGSIKRKRSIVLGGGPDMSSPGSEHEHEHEHDDDHGEHADAGEPDKKRQPGVKRACNECRQQKLRCNVVQDPFQSCTRCNRLKLECKIESNFKRVGKRSKHAEMEKEIERLRRNIARAQSQGFLVADDDADHQSLASPMAANTNMTNMTSTTNTTNTTTTTAATAYGHARNPSLMGSDEAVSSLLHLKRGGSYNVARYSHELEGVRLTDDAVTHLFNEFFAFYHPFLPFLNPAQSPDLYYQQHPLLFWSIVAVAARRFSPSSCPALITKLSGPLTRFLWTTIGEVPSNYYVVKAMCLLCAWPLPTSTTTSDPTHILCGVMMKTATGIGLHRPNHIQDFSRISVDLNKEQLNDRVTTWAVCNIVAQNVGTGYGQPASSLYDWTLALRPGGDPALHLTPELEARLQIERFCDKVSKEMYSNASDPRGVAGDEHRAMLMRVYRREYAELYASIMSQQLGPFVNLHLRAAALHMRLSGFFDSSQTPGYIDDLMGLWRATTSFLDDCLVVDNKVSAPRNSLGGGVILLYATSYIQQMLVAAAFTLLKLMKSFFSKTIDFPRGRDLFNRSIRAIRATSVVTNDLQWRLAELMVQMWNGARLDALHKNVTHGDESPIQVDDSLQLKVRCRHSMSLVFDSVWRWREEYQSLGRGTLEAAIKHPTIPTIPTNPDSANESSTAPSQLDATLISSRSQSQSQSHSHTSLPPSTSTSTSTSTSNLMLNGNGALTPGSSEIAGPALAANNSSSSNHVHGNSNDNNNNNNNNNSNTIHNNNGGGSNNTLTTTTINNNNNNNGNSNNGNGNGNGNGNNGGGGSNTNANASSSSNAGMMGNMSYDAGYDFFDPQHWMLDGLLDFTYSFVPPLEGGAS